jgi:hypothetical protein
MPGTRAALLLLLTATLAFCVASQEKPASTTDTDASAGQPQNTSTTDAHHIAVLVLNAKTGKPVKDLSVTLKATRQNGEGNWPQSVRSNSQGIAEFSLVEPLPDRVALVFEMNIFVSCSDSGFSTERILSRGAVSGDMCTPAAVYSTHPPIPGQIVVYGRALSTWDRMCQAVPFLSLFF